MIQQQKNVLHTTYLLQYKTISVLYLVLQGSSTETGFTFQCAANLWKTFFIYWLTVAYSLSGTITEIL